MLSIDGIPVDLTKPDTLNGITILPGSSITQKTAGVVTTLTDIKPDMKSAKDKKHD